MILPPGLKLDCLQWDIWVQKYFLGLICLLICFLNNLVVNFANFRKVKTVFFIWFYSLFSIHCSHIINSTYLDTANQSSWLSKYFFVIFDTLLLVFTCIDFIFIFLSQGIAFVTAASHLCITTRNDLITNHVLG